MADTVSSSYRLSLVADFIDGDDRTLTIQNPNPSITWTDIRLVSAAASGVLIGDREGSAFKNFKSANLVQTEIHKLDLN